MVPRAAVVLAHGLSCSLWLTQLARVDGAGPGAHPLSSQVKAHWGQELLSGEWRGLVGARGLPGYLERVSR